MKKQKGYLEKYQQKLAKVRRLGIVSPLRCTPNAKALAPTLY
jgi:hypothetical protein